MLRQLKKHVQVFGARGWAYALVSRLAKGFHFETRVRVPVPGHPSRSLEVRLGTSDLEVLREVFYLGELEVQPPVAPRFILDAGANVGFSTVYFALQYPDATVLAVEIEESNFRQLRHNVAGLPNVVPLRAALWGTPALLRIVDSGQGKWAFTVAVADPGRPFPEEERIPGVTVEELMNRFGCGRIGIFKLDIEGGEKSVLQNSAPWIDRVDCLVVELHDRLIEGCSEAFERALDGRDVERLRRGEKVIVRRRPVSPRPRP